MDPLGSSEVEAWNALCFCATGDANVNVDQAMYFDALRAIGAGIAAELAGAPNSVKITLPMYIEAMVALQSIRKSLAAVAAAPHLRTPVTFELEFDRLRALERRIGMPSNRSGLFYDENFFETMQLCALSRSKSFSDYQTAVTNATASIPTSVYDRVSYEQTSSLAISTGFVNTITVRDYVRAMFVGAAGLVGHLKRRADELEAGSNPIGRACAVVLRAKAHYGYELVESARNGTVVPEEAAYTLVALLA